MFSHFLLSILFIYFLSSLRSLPLPLPFKTSSLFTNSTFVFSTTCVSTTWFPALLRVRVRPFRNPHNVHLPSNRFRVPLSPPLRPRLRLPRLLRPSPMLHRRSRQSRSSSGVEVISCFLFDCPRGYHSPHKVLLPHSHERTAQANNVAFNNHSLRLPGSVRAAVINATLVVHGFNSNPLKRRNLVRSHRWFLISVLRARRAYYITNR